MLKKIFSLILLSNFLLTHTMEMQNSNIPKNPPQTIPLTANQSNISEENNIYNFNPDAWTNDENSLITQCTGYSCLYCLYLCAFLHLLCGDSDSCFDDSSEFD